MWRHWAQCCAELLCVPVYMRVCTELPCACAELLCVSPHVFVCLQTCVHALSCCVRVCVYTELACAILRCFVCVCVCALACVHACCLQEAHNSLGSPRPGADALLRTGDWKVGPLRSLGEQLRGTWRPPLSLPAAHPALCLTPVGSICSPLLMGTGFLCRCECLADWLFGPWKSSLSVSGVSAWPVPEV